MSLNPIRRLALLALFFFCSCPRSRPPSCELSPITHCRAQTTGFATIVEAIGEETYSGFAKPIDVLLLQEVTDNNGANGDTQQIVNVLNGIYGTGVYDHGVVEGSSTSSIRQGVVYNTETVELINEVAFGSLAAGQQERQTMRYQLRPVGYDSSADFYAYNNHYKAGSTGSDQSQRLAEATQLRNNADALGDGVNLMYVGDYNMQSSSQAAFQELLSSGPGQVLDPINRLGSWNNNGSFADVHTQSTCASGCPGGHASGGVDDRYDLQLLSAELLDGEGLDYIPGSYHPFGNNGSTYNDSINVGNSITFSGISSFTKMEVLDALFDSSDHLPVVADYQVPAVLEATAGMVPPALSIGQPFDLDILIRNAADVITAIGADELDYSFSVTGDLFGTGSGTADPLAAGDTHFVTLDTNSPGSKSGTITVTTSSQGAPNASIDIDVDFEVLNSGGVFRLDLGRALRPAVADDLNVTDFSFGGAFTSEATLPGSDARTLDFTNSDAMFGIEDRNDMPPATVLDDSAGSDPNDTLGIINAVDTDNFFGVVETVNADNGGELSAEWKFDISQALGDLMLSIEMAAMGNFESSDLFAFDVLIDDNPIPSPFDVFVDESISQTYTLEDGDMTSISDPVVVDTEAGDPVVLSNDFRNFTVPIDGIGAELTLRFRATADGSLEAFAFRNILIDGLVRFGLTGDYNGDGTVNTTDYTIWRDTLGSTVELGTGADGNADGVIDIDDYNVWKSHFGETSGQLTGSLAPIPEPESATVAGMLLIGFAALSRRTRMLVWALHRAIPASTLNR